MTCLVLAFTGSGKQAGFGIGAGKWILLSVLFCTSSGECREKRSRASGNFYEAWSLGASDSCGYLFRRNADGDPGMRIYRCDRGDHIVRIRPGAEKISIPSGGRMKRM